MTHYSCVTGEASGQNCSSTPEKVTLYSRHVHALNMLMHIKRYFCEIETCFITCQFILFDCCLLKMAQFFCVCKLVVLCQ